MTFKYIFILLIYMFFFDIKSENIITNGGTLQFGDNIAHFSLARILSYKYNITHYYTPFIYSNNLVFSDYSKQIEHSMFQRQIIKVKTEKDILDNLNKGNILFYTDILTKIDYINPDHINKLKQELQLKNTQVVNTIPQNIISVAVHIRKGNGGGQHYDGELYSLQQFSFDISKIKYLSNYNNYPFDWEAVQRNNQFIDKVANWETKFPPEQYYLDQIKKLYNDLNKKPLYIQIFTDDKNPLVLFERIKKSINEPNIQFHYKDNQKLSFTEKVLQDIYNMSRFDVLIRSQSYFARAIELIGNHKLIIYPLRFHWENNKLIMNTMVIKGNIKDLIK